MQQRRIFERNAVNHFSKKRVSDTLFFYGFLAIPFLMLVFTTVVINGNSILLAFQSVDMVNRTQTFIGFENFRQVLYDFTHKQEMIIAIKNSLIVYGVSVVMTSVIPILFSYYIYKKLPLHGFFKIVLFLPSIVSPIITVTIYKYLIDGTLYPFLVRHGFTGFAFLSNHNTSFWFILIYYLWMSFGGGLLIQLGAMNTVNPELTEASHLDGVGFFGELWHVVLPKTYQVISVGFIVGIVSIFTNDLGLFAFEGTAAEVMNQTLGYRFTMETYKKELATYPYLAAWGLIATLISVPLSFLARYLIYNFGPQE